ncbi:LapA family protein [Marinicella sediminis]|uniref:LapA family protein n=1 Tax=Marinicella sediminis TaxID=1792834 RepID=A0ABV7J9U6_9GAMM|nr:LapA family protein [Marinicella sediminis]
MSTFKKIFTLILVLLLLTGAIAVSSLNAGHVNINLYWFELNWPLGFALLLCGTLGVLAGLLIGWLYWTWPANRRKMYWKRAYHKALAEQPESSQSPQLTEQSKTP